MNTVDFEDPLPCLRVELAEGRMETMNLTQLLKNVLLSNVLGVQLSNDSLMLGPVRSRYAWSIVKLNLVRSSID